MKFQLRQIFASPAVLFLVLSIISFTSVAKALTKKSDAKTGEIFSFYSEVLDEQRDIYIALPDNYAHSVHDYPLIVVMDAEYLFNITTSIADIQASRNHMPESIVIGLPNNTGKRMDMALELYNDKGEPFFFGDNIGQSDKYLEFFRKELIPTLQKQYRINEHRTIIGMSPTFGPVLQAFWSEPNLFSGYIALAAEIGKYLKSGEMVAEKISKGISDKTRQASAIYVGTSSRDVERRGEKEAALYTNIPAELMTKASPHVSYKFEIVPNEDHYSMAITGIQNGLATIYDREKWHIRYPDFWRSNDPVKALKETYSKLSEYYGFEIVPVEAAFYSVHNLVKTAEIMQRQRKTKKLIAWLTMSLEYYPHSLKLKEMLETAKQLPEH